MKSVLLVFIASFAGFIGGTVSTRIGSASAQRPESGVVRATRFELTIEAGQTLAFWGVDDRQNTVLAFGRRESARAGANLLPGRATDEMRSYKDELAGIGTYNDGIPFLELKGGDGQPRVDLSLTEFEKPRLFMNDENGAKVSLGLDQSDTHEASDDEWSLTFHPDKAVIGMIVDPKQKHLAGHLWLNNKKIR